VNSALAVYFQSPDLVYLMSTFEKTRFRHKMDMEEMLLHRIHTILLRNFAQLKLASCAYWVCMEYWILLMMTRPLLIMKYTC
jgi:hypothetical protein